MSTHIIILINFLPSQFSPESAFSGKFTNPSCARIVIKGITQKMGLRLFVLYEYNRPIQAR